MAHHPAGPEIRLLRPGDDLDAQLDLAERAFGTRPAADRDRIGQTVSALIEQGRALGAFVGGRPAGSAMFHDMRQWWRGRVVPMAGVSSVKVAPEDRGRGIGPALMSALLGLIADRGYPLSVLYPATMPFYRVLGWELAGGTHTAVIPARALRALPPPDVSAARPGRAALRSPGGTPAAAAGPPEWPAVPELRRAGPGDASAVISVISRAHEAARDCGPATWDTAQVRRWLATPGLYAYLGDDGFLAYRWHHGNEDLFVERAAAVSPAAVRALWSHLASYASVAGQVHARVGPADAFWWLTRERDADLRRRERWMLRVVDACAAIAARGFPAAVSLTVPLVIADTSRPGNSGRWELTVAEGKGTLTPGGPARDPLTVGARGLAALYAGTPVVTLRQVGLAAGGSPEDDAALDAAFAATPYLLDTF